MMERILSVTTSWSQLGASVFWMFLLYGFLKLVERLLGLGKFGRLNFGVRFRRLLISFIGKLLTLYELAAVIVIVGIFLFIDPLRHGLLVFILLVAGFSSLKNFVNGRLLLLNDDIALADGIRTDQGAGKIVRRGRFGFYLRTSDGIVHIPYTQMVQEGFSLISGERIGKLCQFHLQAKRATNPAGLPGTLAAIPYIDRFQLPEINQHGDKSYSVTLLLRSNHYLSDVMRTLEELGWECTEEQK